MKRIAWLLIVVLSIVAGLYLNYNRGERRMPDLRGKTPIAVQPAMCPTGVMGVALYNLAGNPDRPEIIAYFRTIEDLQAGKPVAVAIFKTDSTNVASIKIDANLDGIADAVFHTNQEAIAGYPDGPCGLLGAAQQPKSTL